MIEQRSTQVARARAALSDAICAVDGVMSRAAELSRRIAAAQARQEAALAGLRSGELSEDIGAARLAVAKADAEDLERLAAGLQSEVAGAEQARNAAAQTVRHAEEALAHAERAATIQGLDERIAQLEAKLCAAIGERYRLGVEQAGGRFLMLGQAWSPSKTLVDAFTYGIPPAVTH
ncbi:hypothetical protein [Cupriavidus pinatubonensis]|uniref:KfrA N-terminal DNA-binding domain-containing protein n=1 Tax=Cupriavidus pinatubonensis TaxID=248026 RepID=A0ABM8WL84_9BURK|nr:hypothetical protein [Cupriavidus pinatubonensis]CAG9168134.1 hypothetical protein LMG23994_01317 [Cupriavidus pinatubonensis]